MCNAIVVVNEEVSGGVIAVAFVWLSIVCSSMERFSWFRILVFIIVFCECGVRSKSLVLRINFSLWLGTVAVYVDENVVVRVSE